MTIATSAFDSNHATAAMIDALAPGLPRLESAFQPVLSLAHAAAVGYEALLRATHDGVPCSPEEAFGIARRAGRYGEFERACMLHHVRRFVRLGDEDSVLFLNVHPDVLADPVHGPALADDLLSSGMAPERIVIEILEAKQETSSILGEAVARLRSLGFLIALDDFGAGLTNLGRVWDLRPDVVKLDRELICKAVSSYRNARSLLRLVDLLHDIGTYIVVEGIETEEQARLSADCDADFVQGYYFGRPTIEIESAKALTGICAASCNDQLTDARKLRRVRDLDELAQYRHAFGLLKNAWCSGLPIEMAAQHFLACEWALRVYVLDDTGRQVRENVESDRHDRWRRATFPILERAAGANWSKRTYFRDALVHPGETIVSEPYMSASSKNLCVTLSAYVNVDGRGFVLGADILFEGLCHVLA
ncbi:sensor domain-containing phosphodiesterase [Trinickia dinghuensis]|uniref:EAL domain-containing protein n=1 Tax=Trinickia dinghuensis TaxID=2291023 RepID=A0A3D8JWS5_9BURK|nr:EAL domain-containing protein [Trinickia dinghuensis]RDU97537.1 EAL domain-containing protein [Trinickia dinghuensis]